MEQEKTFKEKLTSFLVICAMIMASCILLFLFVASISHTAHFFGSNVNEYYECLYYDRDNILINTGLVILFMGIVYTITRLLSKVDKRILMVISLIVVLALGIWWINFVKAPVKSDQGMVLKAAEDFSENKYDLVKGKGYFYMHPLQFGCVLGLEGIIRVIGSAEPIALQTVNVITLMLCTFVLYLITAKLYKDDAVTKIVSMLSACLILIPLYSVVVYGNIFGFLFSLLAVYFLLKYYDEYKIRYIVLIALSLGLAIMFKSNYEIVMIGILISLFLDLIQNKEIKSLITMIIVVLCFSLVYPIVYAIVEKRSGEVVNEGIPMITYIAMSIQKPVSRNSGWYHDTNNVETIYPGCSFDEEKTIEKSMEIIKIRFGEFIAYPGSCVKFFQDKICSTWIEPAFQTFWWSEPLEVFDSQPEEYKEYIMNNKLLIDILHGEKEKSVIKYLDVIEITIFFASLISITYMLKKKKLDYKNSVLLIIFMGGFLFHIIWETKSIYVIPFYLMLLPSAAYGIYIMFNALENLSGKLWLKYIIKKEQEEQKEEIEKKISK